MKANSTNTNSYVAKRCLNDLVFINKYVGYQSKKVSVSTENEWWVLIDDLTAILWLVGLYRCH